VDFKDFQDTDPAVLFDEMSKAQGKLASKDRQLRDLKRQVESMSLRIEELTERTDQVQLLEHINDTTVPDWLDPELDEDSNHATPFLVLSDLHLDEVVSADELNHLNAYNRNIAEARLQRVIDGTIEIAERYITGLTYDGIVVALAGDIITGIIHDELAESNEATVPETIMHWTPLIASALKRLADTFGNVHVPCVDGNHDRMYKKIRMKKRAQSSYAWIIYNSIAMLCADDERITFNISKSPDVLFDIYDTRFLLDHGDKFRGGGGVGGIYPPLLKWVTRMMNIPSRRFDIAVIGHWHQLIYHTNVFVNGSLKGYDEYAKNNGFSFERPQQLLFFVTPENGVTIRSQVFADHESELDLW